MVSLLVRSEQLPLLRLILRLKHSLFTRKPPRVVRQGMILFGKEMNSGKNDILFLDVRHEVGFRFYGQEFGFSIVALLLLFFSTFSTIRYSRLSQSI